MAARAGTEPESTEGPARPAGPDAVEPRSRRWPAPAWLRPAWLRSAGRVAAGVGVAVLAVEAAVVEAFLVPLQIGTVPFPLSLPAALVGNVLFARWIARVTGRPAASILPGLLWLAAVLTLSAPRPESDVIVPGDWVGLAFLFLGSIAAAYGAMYSIVGRSPRPPGRPDTRR